MKYLSLGRASPGHHAGLQRTGLISLWSTLALLAAPVPALATLNDTGQVTCFKGSRISSKCTGTGQDADQGRDVAVPRAKDGWRGFQFVKVCNSGSVAGKGGCLASAVQGPGPNDWGCTQDKVTGLVWELKTTDGGLHDRNRAFNDFPDHPSSVDVQVAAVNAAGLCGRSDWRRPSLDELFGLADFHENPDGSYPGIDRSWFPDVDNGPTYWSGVVWADPRSAFPGQTWAVRYGLSPTPLHQSRLDFARLRLVRSAR